MCACANKQAGLNHFTSTGFHGLTANQNAGFPGIITSFYLEGSILYADLCFENLGSQVANVSIYMPIVHV